MKLYFEDEEKIYFPQIREYFQEVLSSFSIGNYRSAVVMLYSVALCDLLLKLQELRDMYDDSIAKKILNDISKEKTSSASKSSWEKSLVEKVRNETQLLDDMAFTNLNHLYDHRNYSAHPAINSNFELIAPLREVVYAHIKNTLNSILIKPPIFIKNIFDLLTEDLKEKKELFTKDPDYLEQYLVRKFFSRMPYSMLQKVFISLWKITFIVVDDECNDNREINLQAIFCLINYLAHIDKKEALYDLIEKENRRLGVSTENQCIRLLAFLLTKYPELYSRIHCDTQKQIDNFVNVNPKAKALSWYCFDTVEDHYSWLAKQSIITFREDNIDIIVSRYQEEGKESILFDFFVTTYISSRCFDNADTSFQKLISPYLTRFTRQQILNIIEGTNQNYQLHGRAYSESANREIVETASSILEGIDLSQYTNFKYSLDEESDET